MVKSPENYNEMLSTLNKAAFLTTLLYCVVLVYRGYLPRVGISPALIPPTKDYKELIEWVLSFGVLPMAAAATASFASAAFELHNAVSKATGLRYFWDKHFIVAPLLSRIQRQLQLKRGAVKRIMNEFYYKEVKAIDQHYVHTFWRYALFFWIFFEHILFVLVSLPFVYRLGAPDRYLPLYLIAVVILAAAQFFFVTSAKSTDQANIIPIEKVREYFRTFQP